MLLNEGVARRVLVVAVESSLHALFIANFARLGVLPPPGYGCRPFDRQRKGFVMSEAAAAIALEAPATKTPAPSQPAAAGPCRYPALTSFHWGGDATHLTGSDPEMATLRRLVARAANAGRVDFVHAHATGTPANDEAELNAIHGALHGRSNPRPLPVVSHKGAIGHALGAAGLVAAAISAMAHRHQLIPPTARTTDPIEIPGLSITLQPRPAEISRSILIAGGFGGAVATATLESDTGI